jgi:hypothetical protein
MSAMMTPPSEMPLPPNQLIKGQGNAGGQPEPQPAKPPKPFQHNPVNAHDLLPQS